MEQVYKKLISCLNEIRKKTDFVPEVGLILGSGLDKLADKAEEISDVIAYSDIKGMPVTTVEGHAGKFLFGKFSGRNIVIMQGRAHYYEGYDMHDIVLPVRLMGLMGAKKLVITNAVGGINPEFKPGDLMLITDQISSLVPSPLTGANLDELGVRFPDMSAIYSPRLIKLCKEVAVKTGIDLKEGVYIQTMGPNYESPAEIRMYKNFGADVVGMSTACEAIAANHMGLEICGISCITNFAAGISANPLTHEEVRETGLWAHKKLSVLLTEMIKDI